MRIFAIGRNYAEHIKELNNERPDEPVIFTKPDTAILRDNAPFYYPDFSKDIHHEVELVLRVSKEGKNIEEKFAQKYYDAIGLGIDFIARCARRARGTRCDGTMRMTNATFSTAGTGPTNPTPQPAPQPNPSPQPNPAPHPNPSSNPTA